MNDTFNEIMPESDDRTLCIRVTKPITQEGMRKNFAPRLETLIKNTGEIRLLIHYADYKGWQTEATQEDAIIFLKFGKKIRKIAYVAPPEKEIFKSKINRPLISGDVEFFEEKDLGNALKWVKE